MEKIIITFDIAEQGKYLVVSEKATWKGLCKSATLYNGKKKKKVGAKNMEMNPGLNTIELELEDAENLCDNLFENTEIITCVIPEGTKTIGRECFKNCRKLHTITLPNTIEKIYYEVFSGCDSLAELIMPSSVDNADSALDGFDIDKVRFAPGIEALPQGIFSQLKNPQCEINIPDGVLKIQADSNEYQNLKSIKFPQSLKEIESGAIESSTFGHFEWPENVPVNDQNLAVTGEGFCTLNYMPLPESADVMILTGDYNCNTLVVPANIKEIRFKGYGHITSLRHIYVDPANKVYDSRENCNAIIESATGKMLLAGELTTVPEGVTEIAESAGGIVNTKVCPKLPSTLKKISCSFNEFEEITLDNILFSAVDSIGKFKGRLIISPEIKELPDCKEEEDRWGDKCLVQFFRKCKFETIKFSEGLERIGNSFFKDNKIHGTITLPSTLKSIGDDAFNNSGIIYDDEYRSKDPKEYASVIIPDSVTTIGDAAFADWIPANVTLPNSIEVLKDVFTPTKSAGSKHSTLDIPASVKNIELRTVGSEMFAQADTVICRAATAPQFNREPYHLTDGTILYPKGADYSSWEPLFKGWKFKEIE